MATENYFDLYINRRVRLANLIDRQLDVLNALCLEKRPDERPSEGLSPSELLKSVAGRVASEDLKVLIMGNFNAGKSTFINALLGERILPAKMLPTTAFITVIRYADGDKKRIIVYPKPGLWKGGDKPFEISLHELERHLTINHSSDPGQAKPCPFDRVELYWPLPLCINKVEIIDSPGLNDPDSHDRITLDYLPSADAIVYCMACEHACTRMDMDTIAMLNNQGYTSLIFVLTKIDKVRESALLNGNSEDREFVQVTVNQLKGLTDLDRKGIFFVDSLHAIAAKKNADRVVLDETGIPQLERELEEYLVQNRFRGKLARAIVQARATNNDAQALIDIRMTMANTSLEELAQRLKKAEEPLAQLKQRSELILGRVELGMNGILRGVSDRSRMFFIGCPAKVQGWVDDFEPTKSIKWWNPPRMKESIGALAAEYLAHVKSKLEMEASAWANSELVPWVDAELVSILKTVEAMTIEYEMTVKEIRVVLKFPTAKTSENIGSGEAPTPITNLGALVYGIVTHDWFNAGMVGVFGVKGLLRGLAAQLAAAVVVSIVSLFTPIGWGALLAALAAVWITTPWINFISMKAAIRSKVAAAVEQTLRDSTEQNKMAKGIENQISEEFTRIRKSMRQAVQKDIDPLEAEVKRALAVKLSGEGRVKEEKELLHKASQANLLVAKEIEYFNEEVKMQ